MENREGREWRVDEMATIYTSEGKRYFQQEGKHWEISDEWLLRILKGDKVTLKSEDVLCERGDMKLKGTWNRLRYKLMGSPKYCKDCGRELEWVKFGGQWDKRTGKQTIIYLVLTCSKYIARGGMHTHIYFDKRVS